MASVDWLKMTTQRAGSMIKHNSQEARFEVEHSNPDIDKELTSLNYTIGAPDYKDMLRALKKRIDEVDKKHPPLRVKADRITCCMLVAPCPLEIQRAGKEKQFFEDMQKVYYDFFGKGNVLGSCIHYDEQHEYIDKDGTKRMSLVHAHTLVAAYAEWKDKDGKERAGINGKNFMTKARLTGLNKAMCSMVKKNYDVDYNTGMEPRKEKTEKLKADSLRNEVNALEVAVHELEARKDILVTPLDEIPRKGLLESQRSYNERLELEETKKALEKQKKWLLDKESYLEKEEKKIQLRLENKKHRLESKFLARSSLIGSMMDLLNRELNSFVNYFRKRLTPQKKEAGRKHYHYRQTLEDKEWERKWVKDYEKTDIQLYKRDDYKKTFRM